MEDSERPYNPYYELMRWLETNGHMFNDSGCACCSRITLAEALAKTFPDRFMIYERESVKHLAEFIDAPTVRYETSLAEPVVLMAIHKLACAHSQVSGVFHKAWYGHWPGNYEHSHHPDCCDPITHYPKGVRCPNA